MRRFIIVLCLEAALALAVATPRFKSIDLGQGKCVEVLAAWPVWPATVGLARVVAHVPSLVGGKRVLELGCGLGAVGLAAAAAGASEVLLTSPDKAVLKCAAQAAEETGKEHISSAWLDWSMPGESDVMAREEPFDLIMAADVLHDDSDPVEIAQLLDQVMWPGSCCLIADPVQRSKRPAFKKACAVVGLKVTEGPLPIPSEESEVRLLCCTRPAPPDVRAAASSVVMTLSDTGFTSFPL